MLPTTAQYTALANSSEDIIIKPSSPPSRWRRTSIFSRRNAVIAVAATFLVWFFLSYTPSPHTPYPGPSVHSHPTQENLESDVDWPERATEVKRAFQHAFHGWQKYASPHDELLPLSNRSQNNFNGWGVSNVDSLDTMFLMGLHEEFDYGLKLVQSINFTQSFSYIPFFETTIRYLGGLLSAYAFSHDFALLDRAEELGQLMMPIFHSNSGLAEFSISMASGKTTQSGFGTAWLAEFGTVELEYKYLAYLTGKKEYYDAANNVTANLVRANVTKYDGLLPMLWNLSSGEPANNHVAIGGMSDSGYEYILKEWLLTGKQDRDALELYKRTANAIIKHLLYMSPVRDLLYVTDVYMYNGTSTSPSRKFEHLSCFLPGLFALGVDQLPPDALTPEEREMHLWAAEGLAYSCYLMYIDQETGLGPEEVVFWGPYEYHYWETEQMKKAESGATPATEEGEHGNKPTKNQAQQTKWSANLNDTEWIDGHRWVNRIEEWKKGGKKGVVPGLHLKERAPVSGMERDYRVNNAAYLLRPETIESLYLLWRVTGDIRWRERGYELFKNIEKVAKTPSGFATIMNVEYSPPILKDEMPSFFLAETLKYLYLLCAEPDLIPLDKYVFNTEAHPLPVFQWTDWQKYKFEIP